MARREKKEGTAAAADQETEERARLKKLAFSRHVLSQNPPKVGPTTALGPSKTVLKHHGKDILRKSQRKNRYLFSFPGFLGPVSGGKIGDLKDLGTKNPVLYLDFPQGQMKLFGTITYPKNRYLTLQFSKGGKNVTCDDYFDNMIVFSDAWWIGTKDENPEELQLQFPNELNLEKHAEYDFKGGVGVTCDRKQAPGIPAMKCLEQESPKVDLEDDLTDSPINSKQLVEVTPSRHSARTAGKTFNFAEASSGDDFIGNGAETSEEEDEKVDLKAGRNYTSRNILVIVFFPPVLELGFCYYFPPLTSLLINAMNLCKLSSWLLYRMSFIFCKLHFLNTFSQTESSCPVVFDIDNEDSVKHDPDLEQNKRITKSKDFSNTGRSSLVQTNISTLFKKVEEKVSKVTKGAKNVEEREAGIVTEEQKKQLKRTEFVDSVTDDQRKSKGKASSSRKGRVHQVLASESSDPYDSAQDMDCSDEDWSG